MQVKYLHEGTFRTIEVPELPKSGDCIELDLEDQFEFKGQRITEIFITARVLSSGKSPAIPIFYKALASRKVTIK